MSDSVLGNPRRTILRSDDLFRRRRTKTVQEPARRQLLQRRLARTRRPRRERRPYGLGHCLSLRCDLAAGQRLTAAKPLRPLRRRFAHRGALSARFPNDHRVKKSTEILRPEAEGMDVTLRNDSANAGQAQCLRRQHELPPVAYQQRTAVLEFRPFPEAAPVDRFVGNSTTRVSCVYTSSGSTRIRRGCWSKAQSQRPPLALHLKGSEQCTKTAWKRSMLNGAPAPS